MGCCLLHNLIRKFMSFDPQEFIDEDDSSDEESTDDDDEIEYINHISPTDQWLNFRNNLATNM
ncbi:hypothetical protein OROHE_019998 [Orobanche hederae]